MTSKEAEQTLTLIRGLMERSTRYTNLSGHAGIAAGVSTLVGCALRMWVNTPFLSTWIGVLIAATGASIYYTAAMARGNGEPPWSRQAQTVALAFTPAFVAGLVLTAVLAQVGQAPLLPGVWMLLWGVGALAMSLFTPRAFCLLGVAFMVAGSFTLFTRPTNDVLTMGLSFGGIHLAYGTILFIVRHPARAVEPLLHH
jgi:multisubunit Na+/H+ antiporter MnhC subunit